ncbi:MAG: hypothetical protein M0Q88_00475 [Bacilli bacterium]|nr:hypothetical protein [Bacilli bacterium]
MANNNKEYEEIQKLLEVYSKKLEEVAKKEAADFLKLRSDALAKLEDQERIQQEYIQKQVMEAILQNRFETAEQVAKYEQRLQDENLKDKLEAEIQNLKNLSKTEEDKRKKQLDILKKEKEVAVFKSKGQNSEAKKVEKELAKLKKEGELQARKEKLQQEGAGYEFGDALKEQLFQPLTDEIALGNAAQRSAEKAMINSLKSVGKAITEGLNVINRTISDYAKYQTSINARLQGRTTFGELVDTLDEVAFSPLISASNLYSNLNDLVNQGIVTNVAQRAFFATIKDGISTTFDATSESLNRIIRIQRNDSTAARLGMESYLTRFLNVYVENTEYLQSTFDNVASSLLEASAVLGRASGVGASLEFEYVVQKWLGTLTGIGLSDQTAQSIATALGRLGAGDVDVLTDDIGKLLTMSASAIGINIGEVLNEGLDAATTNKLLMSMVGYLQTLADTGTNVTKAELAKVFGVSISDLVAVAKMQQSDIRAINDDLLSYTGMYTSLRNQFNQLPSRMGIANILENLFSNLTYQTGMSIAANPVSFAMWKITDLIQGVTGGINIPFITALGTGIDLNTTVENLMKLGLVGVNMLGNIGNIVNGMRSIGSGEVLLDKLQISAGSGNFKTFGPGLNLGAARTSGSGTSQITYIGQEDSDSYHEATIAQQKSKSDKELQKEISSQEENNPTLKILKYLAEDVDLKGTAVALTAAATNKYELLNKISTESTNIITALTTLNTNILEKVIPAINSTASVNFGSKIFDKTAVMPLFSSENTLISSNLTSVTTVSSASPVTEYLDKINFIDDFKSIVENIAEINRKIPSSLGVSSTLIEGLTQVNRRA